jgi:peptidoglycan hydrolase-like protein with peptidoglycan-binding domain
MSSPLTFRIEPFTALDIYEAADLDNALDLDFDGDHEVLGEVCRSFEIDSADYIKWVQRSLNRILGSGLVVDGKPTKSYRDAVQQFQQKHRLTVNGEVNRRTADKLILDNEANVDYVKWAQRALNTDGAALDPDGRIGSSSSKTKKAIRMYQTKRTPALCVDGFLGAKTELFLISESGMAPPGDLRAQPQPQPPPKPISTDFPAFLQAKLRDSLEFLEEEAIRPNETTICLMKKLMDRRTNDLWMDPAEITQFFAGPLRKAGMVPPTRSFRDDLLQDLKKGFGRGPIKLYVRRFEEVHLGNIVNALNQISHSCDIIAELSAQDPRCRAVRSLLVRLAKDPRSLYNCKAFRERILR